MMIKAKLDHKKDICEIDVRGTFAEVTNEVASIVENIYEALDEPFKSIYRAALIKAIEEGELIKKEVSNGN